MTLVPRTKIEPHQITAMRVTEVTENGVWIGGHFWETTDVAGLGTALTKLGTRIHTAALEWEPADEEYGPFDVPLPLRWAPDGHRVPVPDVAGGDL